MVAMILYTSRLISFFFNFFCLANCLRNIAALIIVFIMRVFQVVSIEPSEEPVLRVNRSKTALVLGGSVPSAVPPDLLIPGPKHLTPLQGDTVQTLASILTPTLCSSALSSRFRVAILLYGLSGV